MAQAGKPYLVLLGGMLAVTGCAATSTFGRPEGSPLVTDRVLRTPAIRLPTPSALSTPGHQDSADSPDLPAFPPMEPDDRPLPINLPTALQLANVRSIDIAAAAERIQLAAAVLSQSNALWLPTITLGGDYYRHDGNNQTVQGGHLQR